MPSQEEKALDYAIENSVYEPQKSSDIIRKLGVNQEDIKAWKFSKQNPDDPQSTAIRNKIFTKIADNVPIDKRRGFGFIDRFAIKNFADNDIKLQNQFLKDRGAITKIQVKDQRFDTVEEVEDALNQINKKNVFNEDYKPLTLQSVGAEIIARKPDQSSFSKIEPESIDKFAFADWVKEAAQDITDVTRELVEAGAVTLSTGSKLIGSVGGPAGLGVAAAGSAISGAIGGITESLRQRIGSDIGLARRDPEKVREQAIITGAIPLGLEAVKGAAKVGSKTIGLIPRALGVRQKASVEAIKKASEELGVTPTPGQIFETPAVAKLEESLVKGGDFKIGGIITRLPKQVAANKRVVSEAADSIVESRSLMKPFEAGSGTETKFMDELARKIKPAEDIYQKYETLFKDIKPNLTKLRKSLKDLADEFKFDDEAARAVKNQAAKLKQVVSLDDLKKFRTSTGKILRDIKAPKRAAKQMYDAATEVRNDTLIEAARKSGGEVAELAAKEIPQADAIYRQAAKAVERSLLRKGAVSKLSPTREAETFFAKTKEIDVVNKILDTNDPVKIRTVQKEFPETFEFLRLNKIEDIAKRAEKKIKIKDSVIEEVDPKKLAKIIAKLPQESRDLIFGPGEIKKAESLATYLNSLPRPFNTSNSTNMLDFGGFLNPIGQIDSTVKGVLMEIIANTQLGNTLINKAARGVASPAAKGAAVGAKSLLIPQQEEE